MDQPVSMTRKQSLWLALATIAFPGLVGAEIHGPIVQWSSNPETQAHIRWIESVVQKDEWQVGKSGFGYGDDDDATVIRGMEDNFSTIYIRRELVIPEDLPAGAKLMLLARYDDAFTLAIDGEEMVRENVRIVDGREQVILKHEADKWEETEIARPTAGTYVISATGFNDGLSSSDFTLDLALEARWEGGSKSLIPKGAEWSYLAGKKPAAGWQTKLDAPKEPELRGK